MVTATTTAITFRTDFAGGGLVDAGYIAAGMTPEEAVEFDPAKCDVYRANWGNHIICGKVEDVKPSRKSRRFRVYHVSPSCKNFSQAKSGGVESPEDLAVAYAIAANIEYFQPEVFTLENVRKYRGSKSFAVILAKLDELGYQISYRIVNAADYGVPQTRHRLLLVATRKDMPRFTWPVPTHHNGQPVELKALQAGLFDDWVLPNTAAFSRKRWLSWYEAIADLIPALQEDEFADWQLERLPKALAKLLAASGSAGAYVDSTNSKKSKLYRAGAEPAFTVTTLHRPANMPKAFLLGLNQSGDKGDKIVVRTDTEPGLVVTASQATKTRAFVVDGIANSNGRTVTARTDCEARFTIRASTGHKGVVRSWLADNGRVVRLNTLALARLQMNHFADSYKFSGNNRLDAEIIGNGYPSLLAQRMGEQIVKLFR